jgi:predicted metal-dependent peptidase
MAMMLRDPIDKKLKQAKVGLLMSNPFFGTLLMHLKLVDATESEWCPTAAVDGRNIYYNREFISTLDVEETKFVLCHELEHVMYDHFGRRSHRDPVWWNMANDFVINGQLVSDGIGKMPTKKIVDPKEVDENGATAQRVGLYDAKYIGWSSEAVYDDLEKRKVRKQLTLDVHIDLGKDAKIKSGKEPKIPIKVSEEELKSQRDEFKGKILQAAAAVGASNLPESIQRLIGSMVQPKINWRDLLRLNIQSCLTDDFSFMRPNRRHMYSGIFLPNLTKDEMIDVHIAIDTSGSITQEMAQHFLSEIYGMMTIYPQFKIGIICYDTTAHNYQEFTPETMDDLLEYKIIGGGGTDFNAFWNYWIDNDITPKKAIVMTDGYNSDPINWGPVNYCDTTWIIVDGVKSKVTPPFGEYAYFDFDAGIEEIGNV